MKHDGLLIGSGWYERSSASESVMKSDPAAYTKAFVEKAINRYDNEGRDATIEYYNTAASVDGQWYVFIADENDTLIAHATIPKNVGLDLKGDLGKDIYGYDFGRELVSATDEGKWVDYFYLNPAHGERRERKHAWVIKHDGLPLRVRLVRSGRRRGLSAPAGILLLPNFPVTGDALQIS